MTFPEPPLSRKQVGLLKSKIVWQESEIVRTVRKWQGKDMPQSIKDRLDSIRRDLRTMRKLIEENDS